MAPIPRCDIRLPSEPRGRRVSATQNGAAADDDDDQKRSGADDETVSGGVVSGASRSDYDAAGAGASSTTTPASQGHGSLHAQRSRTRDSAEILEDASQFSTGVTRDMVEIREHKLHESTKDGGGGSGGATGLGDDEDGSAGAAAVVLDPCTVLEQCRAEIEAEAAAASAAAAVSDEEDTTSSRKVVGATAAASAAAAAAPSPTATPGDVCAQFCKNRANSPSSGYNLREAVGGADDAGAGRRKRAPRFCKGTYAALETYTSLLGSAKAVSARKKLELEMKKKRKFYETVHERNRRRREREKRRAKEKRRMMRCRDQSKIPSGADDVSINKAFYFRFNYNKRLPFMPSAMDQHFKRFKKPPFKHFHKGARACHKLVDEFEKLRVTETNDRKDRSAAAASAAAAPKKQQATRSSPRPPRPRPQRKAKA